MTTEKKYAKDLTAGEWIWLGVSAYAVRQVTDYGNGWFALHLSDGEHIDCLAFRSFAIA